MKKNLESVAQRGEHIDQLQDKSENLNQSAQGFRRGANRVRKQMWWKNMKMRIWIMVGIIVLLLLIIIPGESEGFGRLTGRLLTSPVQSLSQSVNKWIAADGKNRGILRGWVKARLEEMDFTVNWGLVESSQ